MFQQVKKFVRRLVLHLCTWNLGTVRALSINTGFVVFVVLCQAQ
jgi:hypothetical protein